MSKQKHTRKPKPVAVSTDINADTVSDAPGTAPEVASAIPDVWLVHKATSLTSIVVRRESDNFLARCRVRNAAKYRRNVPVNVVGTVATGLYEGKPPVVKRVEVAS